MDSPKIGLNNGIPEQLTEVQMLLELWNLERVSMLSDLQEYKCYRVVELRTGLHVE